MGGLSSIVMVLVVLDTSPRGEQRRKQLTCFSNLDSLICDEYPADRSRKLLVRIEPWIRSLDRHATY